VSAGKTRYQTVASALGAIPWYVIGVINELESTSNFRTHLHNGDPLTDFTRHVPAGRPQVGHGPPFTWEDSAQDALTMKGYHQFTDWRLSRILHRLEAYNGYGSRRRGIFTPYLWSGSQHYTRGKYVRDGVWDPNAVSAQIGCAVILHQLAASGTIQLQIG
jgi:lysozyme family protein